MMYTLNAQVLPVDVHVHRVAGRLGWTKRKRADRVPRGTRTFGSGEIAFFISCGLRPPRTARFAGPMSHAVQTAAFANPATTSKTGDVMPNRPTAVHLYSGVGGMSLGFEQAGFNIAAAVDIEKNNVETHKRNFPNCNSWQADLSLASGEQIQERNQNRRRHGLTSLTGRAVPRVLANW